MQVVECIPGTEHIAALQAAGLPTDDLADGVARCWWCAHEAGTWHGLVALERHAGIGLLRSLLVRPELRRAGTGRILVSAVEGAAAEAGLAALYLLTTDADGYFARLGYAVVDRPEVPQAIRATAQFSRLCPASAIVMQKVLYR